MSTSVQGDRGQRWRKGKGEGGRGKGEADYPNNSGVGDMPVVLIRRCCWGS